MVHKEENVTNGVNGSNGVTKAKTLAKSFDPIADCVEAFGMPCPSTFPLVFSHSYAGIANNDPAQPAAKWS
jgi:hypothetical protein